VQQHIVAGNRELERIMKEDFTEEELRSMTERTLPLVSGGSGQ
jgi:hypothetical protein